MTRAMKRDGLVNASRLHPTLDVVVDGGVACRKSEDWLV